MVRGGDGKKRCQEKTRDGIQAMTRGNEETDGNGKRMHR